MLNGNVVSPVGADPRKTGQWTGWNLKGLTGTPTFTGSGAIQWNDPTFGETTFPGGYDFGAYDFGAYDFGAYDFGDYQFADYQFGPAGSFGAWDTDNTNAEPDVCENSGNVEPGSLNHTFTNGPVEESAVTSSTPVEGPVVEGEVIEDEVQTARFMRTTSSTARSSTATPCLAR